VTTITPTRARRAVRNLRTATVDPTTLADVRWSACALTAVMAFALLALVACV